MQITVFQPLNILPKNKHKTDQNATLQATSCLFEKHLEMCLKQGNKSETQNKNG